MEESSLDKRIENIESRLTRIESYLDLPISEQIRAKEISSLPQSDSERVMTSSGNWLGVIAIICYIAAAGFIIKLSIESGWLTPPRQIGIAVLFGFILIGVGLWLLESDKEYTSLLPASGVIVLYLSTFAAYRLYALIPFDIAIMLCGSISLLCIILYLRIRHDVYPLTAATGAYLAPIILGFHVESVFTLYYFVICSMTFSIISILLKSRSLTILSAYLAILTTGYVGINLNQNKLISLVLALHFIIFSIGTIAYSIFTKIILTEKESWEFFPVLLIFYVAEYYFLSQSYHDLAAWLSLAFAGFLLLLYLLAKTQFSYATNSQSMIMSFVSIVLFHSGYVELLPADAGPWLFVGITLLFAFTFDRMQSKEKNNLYLIPLFIIFLIILCNEYIKMIFSLMSFQDLDLYYPFVLTQKVHWIPLCLSIISLWTLYFLQKDFLRKDQSYAYIMLGLTHLLVVLALYRLTNDYNSLVLSLSWLIYAIVIIIFSFVRKDKLMANSALFVLFFAAAKALLYDAASAPTIIRILCLIVTGVVLYGSGMLFRRIAKWKS